MKRLLLGLTVGIAALAVSSAGNAQGLNTPISSDGKPLAVSEAASGPVSESFSGLSDAEARSELMAQTTTPEEFASFSSLKPLGAESIIGVDTRTKVGNTTKYPYRAIVLIVNTTNGFRCTGWLINKNTVVTAGHCVYDPGVGWYSVAGYTLYPGYTGSSAPYGSCKATTLYTVNGWALSGKDDYDYGAIKLNCSIGNTVGWFGYFWKSGSLKGLPTFISGYPGDKPLEQWKTGKFKVTVSQTRRTFYKNDTVGGMSGSAVYYNRSTNCNPCSMAVHAYGTYGSAPFSNNNHGTRITQAVFNNLTNWKNAN